ncbi:MAG: ATP-binding cassette domain-containing protein [Paludibacteraceae bacterium]|nr:ATP-binding cassette domain-containing protein [Paludibacteraceae bacterium]
MSLEVKNICKSYGSQQVLFDVNLRIDDGRIVAFLGPNGAGKSTLMKLLTGYLKPDSGEIRVEGVDVLQNPRQAQRLIGYLPEHNPLYLEMYVKEYLQFTAGLYGMDRIPERVDAMIEKTGLTGEYRKRIGELSKGYRQRVGLAQALIHEPRVLILDEPTTGLDPNQLIEIRGLIKEFGRDRTVLFSTHILQEVHAICDRMVVLRKGRFVADKAVGEVAPEALEDMFHELTR